MKTKSILIVIATLFFSFGISAQTITGKVTDVQNQPIEFANIALYSLPDSLLISGTATDKDGIFTIKNVKKGDYFLNLSRIEFKSRSIKLLNLSEDTNLGVILLDSASVLLDEITVEAKTIIKTQDKFLIFPTEKQKTHSSDGFEMLQNLMLPNINVNAVNNTVETPRGNVTLCINGREASQQEVRAIRPKDISRIEYEDMPMGQFAGKIAVINYILKQYEYGGYLSLNGQQRLSYLHGDYMATAKVSYKASEFGLLIGETYSKDTRFKTNINEDFHFENYDVNRVTETIKGVARNNQQFALLSYIHKGSKSYLMGQLGYVQNSTPDNEQILNLLYTGYNNGVSKIRTVLNQKNKKPTFGLYYNIQLPKNQVVVLQLSSSYAKNIYERNYTDLDNNKQQYTNINENFYNIVGDVYYAKRINAKNSLGINMTHYHKIIDNLYKGDITEKQSLNSAETHFLMSYQHIFSKKLSLQALMGVALNQYSAKNIKNRKELSYRPSIGLQYSINGNSKIQYNGSLSNSFPVLSYISNVEQYIDFMQIKKGNPDLSLTKWLNNNLSYSYWNNKINMSAYFNSFSGFNITKEDYYTREPYLVRTYISDGNYHLLNPGVSISFKLLNNNLNFKIDGGLKRTVITGKYAISENCWQLSANVNYILKDFSFNIYGSTPDKSVIMIPSYYRNNYDYGAFVAYNKSNLSLTLGTQRPFSDMNQIWTFNTPAYAYTKENFSSSASRMFYFKFSYNFEFGRKTNFAKTQINKNIESAIMKPSE